MLYKEPPQTPQTHNSCCLIDCKYAVIFYFSWYKLVFVFNCFYYLVVLFERLWSFDLQNNTLLVS